MTRVAGWDGDGEVREERRQRAASSNARYLAGLVAYNKARLEQAQAATGAWADMDEPERLEEVAEIADVIEYLAGRGRH